MKISDERFKSIVEKYGFYVKKEPCAWVSAYGYHLAGYLRLQATGNEYSFIYLLKDEEEVNICNTISLIPDRIEIGDTDEIMTEKEMEEKLSHVQKIVKEANVEWNKYKFKKDFE